MTNVLGPRLKKKQLKGDVSNAVAAAASSQPTILSPSISLAHLNIALDCTWLWLEHDGRIPDESHFLLWVLVLRVPCSPFCVLYYVYVLQFTQVYRFEYVDCIYVID